MDAQAFRRGDGLYFGLMASDLSKRLTAEADPETSTDPDKSASYDPRVELTLCT
jgi:hypothetical protein